MSAPAKPVVLIAEELSPATIEALGPDFEIRTCNGADRAELIPAIADVDAILVRSATKVDAEALAAATRLKVVARAGVGLDNVDVKAATQAGVMVVNAPTSNIVSAAELAVASPLLEASIDGAHGVLLSIQGGSNLGIFEINDAARLVQEAVHPEANIIFGAVIDDTLGDEVRVTVIAAGFDGGEPSMIGLFR